MILITTMPVSSLSTVSIKFKKMNNKTDLTVKFIQTMNVGTRTVI